MSVQFIAGFPRSGSEVLINFLAQNPNHFVTPTNGLIELFGASLRGWRESDSFKAQGLGNVKPHVLGSIRGQIEGFYRKQLERGMTCFDKSRGWPQFVEHLSECLERPVKLIVTVRDVRAVLASMEKLYRNRSIDWSYPVGEDFFKASTAVGRANVMLASNNLIGHPINQLRDLLERSPESVHLVSYDKFVNDPLGTVQGIHEALGLPEWDRYDPDHVEQVTKEDDSAYGRGATLHKIRPKIEPPEDPAPWKKFYTDQFSQEVLSAYADIHELL